jgi:hypothetical protein
MGRKFYKEEFMIAPAEMFIEMAQERVKNVDYINRHSKILITQEKEVRNAIPNQTDEFYTGYAIGIETARILLEGMLDAVKNKITI